MEEIAVSCIVPVYNLESKLKRCVESLLGQTLRNIEIILVNDCSTDGSKDVISEYARLNANITDIHLNENVKQGGARNEGLKAAKGEYIAFIDGDDWIEADMLEALYQLAKREDLDIVDSDYYQEDEHGNCVKRSSIPNEYLENIDIKKLILHHGRIWTKIFRRSLLMIHKLYFIQGKKFEDNPYLPTVFMYTERIGKVRKAFYHYIYNTMSTSRKRNDDTVFDRMDTAVYLLKDVKRRGLYESYKEEIDFKFIELYYANTIITCITKFDHVQYQNIKKAYKEIRYYLPEYRRNRYISCSPLYIRLLTRFHLISIVFVSFLISILQKTKLRNTLTKGAKSQ